MGIGASSQLPPPGDGHHPLFYKGVKALSEGRYTLSETYFHQAIQRHPGRDFWDHVLDAALPKKHKHIGGFADEGKGDLRDGPSSLITEILLPLDNKFVELHDFARLVADIAVNYYYKAVALGTHAEADLVRRVGMLYSGYLALRMQIGMLLLHVMLAECTEARVAADELEKVDGAAAVSPSRKANLKTTTTKSTRNTTTTTTDTADTADTGNNNESGSVGDGTTSQHEAGKPQFSPTNPPPPELLIKILSLKEKCVMMWISSIISYANTALQCTTLFPTTPEGDHSRQKVMTMAWTCVDYVLSVLRNVASVYKNLTTASIFEAYLEEMKKAMNAVGQGSEGNLELGDVATQHSRSETHSFDNSMAFMSSSDSKKGGADKHFIRHARSLNLSMAPLIHTMLIVNVRFRADMSSGVVNRIPSSLHPVNHSVYHYIDWLLRDLSAAPIYAGKSDFFLRVNKIVMPLDVSDRLAFRMLMGEEVLLMSYPVLFLEATLFRQISRTESIPQLMRRATELVLTTYGGDSAMCYEINELFKKFLGASM